MTLIEAFINRWQHQHGGAERANYALFLTELAGILGVPRPQPASAVSQNYVFERPVKRRQPDGSETTGRIDLYKSGCFVLEAKQSRLPGQTREVALARKYLLRGQDLN